MKLNQLKANKIKFFNKNTIIIRINGKKGLTDSKNLVFKCIIFKSKISLVHFWFLNKIATKGKIKLIPNISRKAPIKLKNSATISFLY